jgi:predicted N-acetyltransferase YhbS
MAPSVLPGGLLLRSARASDIDQIADLVAARGEPADADDLRLVVDDPDAGPDAVAVVVDGDRVVSTATLLDETLRVRHPAGVVELSAGQVELVATDRDYEGRGLVRALMGWAHDRSTARGHLVQVMVGIPYFYRRFGYEYAIDIPPSRSVRAVPSPAIGVAVRIARHDDLPALARLQAGAQSNSDVTLPRPLAEWRWVLAGTGTTTWVAERDGEVVACGRTVVGDAAVVLAEPAAADTAAALALLHGTAAPSRALYVVDRAGTITSDAWHDLLEPPNDRAEQYYLRLADPVAVLERFRPALTARLAASAVDHSGREVVVSTFERHYRMAVAVDGTLGPVTLGGPLQAPGAIGGCGIAPDALAAVLTGPLGIHGLSRRRPDVYPGPDSELFATLFPPLTADLLTWYLPY